MVQRARASRRRPTSSRRRSWTAWRNFSRVPGPTPGQLRAWLRAILIHASLNARRRPREARHRFRPRRWSTSPARRRLPARPLRQNASREALDAALGGLSERHRTVIHLRIWDQLSFAQIGAKLGISEDAARMLYGRAIAKLRESMRPGHDPG